MSAAYLLDSNIYIRGIRDARFAEELMEFHRANLPRLVMSAVVVSELLVGAQTPAVARALTRTFVEPFRARRRFMTPGWGTWERATHIDRAIRRAKDFATALSRRSFFHDILIAATAREIGATIVTFNVGDFAVIGQHVDVEVQEAWPAGHWSQETR